jgi:uncharacterized membrane protein AbrB (regulator of aidB expression)
MIMEKFSILYWLLGILLGHVLTQSFKEEKYRCGDYWQVNIVLLIFSCLVSICFIIGWITSK